jgi:hypothetical protein
MPIATITHQLGEVYHTIQNSRGIYPIFHVITRVNLSIQP